LPVLNTAKGEAVAADVRANTGNNNVRVAALDLIDIGSVRAFAKSFLATQLPLHILINNAGIMTGLQKDLTFDEMNAMGWFDEHGKPRVGFKSVEGGAATATWAATSKLLEDRGGEYLEDCNVAKLAAEGERISGVNAHALDKGAAQQLWKLSEQLLDERFSFS